MHIARTGSALLLLLALSSEVRADPIIYTGSLSSASGGMVGTNEWADNLTFSWNVSFNDITNLWTYSYQFQDLDAGQKKMSVI